MPLHNYNQRARDGGHDRGQCHSFIQMDKDRPKRRAQVAPCCNMEAEARDSAPFVNSTCTADGQIRYHAKYGMGVVREPGQKRGTQGLMVVRA